MSKNSAPDRGDSVSPAGPVRDTPKLPAVLEMTFSLASLLVVLIGAAVVILSLVAGCPIYVAALRGGAAILIVGLVLWMLAWILAGGTFSAASHDDRKSKKAVKNNKEEVQSTREVEA
jgi:protein-S-isoprenylcysteine O-methyltransferase Ste14